MRARATVACSVLLLIPACLPAIARGDGFALDLGKTPVVALFRAPMKRPWLGKLYKLTDREVRFTAGPTSGLNRWSASWVDAVETDTFRFVYDRKMGFFLVDVKGRPSTLRPPSPPQESKKPAEPPRYNGKDKDEEAKAKRAEQDYDDELRKYKQELSELPAKQKEYEQALKEWPAKQAAEKERVEKLAEQIQDAEKQFDGKVRFEMPIDGHTAGSVDSIRRDLQLAGR
jgi:hypothetical protein